MKNKENSPLQQYLIKGLKEVTELDSVDSTIYFSQLGIDSLKVLEFTTKLQDTIPEIPLTIFLECKNIDELSTYLEENYKEDIKNLKAKLV